MIKLKRYKSLFEYYGSQANPCDNLTKFLKPWIAKFIKYNDTANKSEKFPQVVIIDSSYTDELETILGRELRDHSRSGSAVRLQKPYDFIYLIKNDEDDFYTLVSKEHLIHVSTQSADDLAVRVNSSQAYNIYPK